MRRKIIILCITALLFMACSFPAVAEESDLNKTGSISVTLIDQKEPLVGAELSVYCVATATPDANGHFVYECTEDFKSFDIATEDAALAAKLDAFVAQHSVPSVKMTTDAEGTARCGGLRLGLYFVKQTGEVDGFAPCTPFLVTVPNEYDGQYLYDVNATPKTEVVRLTSITVKKVWNTDKSTAATKQVTVQLLKNGDVVETAILNEENHWQMTYNNMPVSDGYSIKEMDVPKGFTATYKQNDYVFTVTNTATLIQTGQLMWPIPVLAAGGVLFIAIGIALLQKKRKTNA